MPDFLKGNYELPQRSTKRRSGNRKPGKSLTERMEEKALAKLGGSMCFVMKGKTFLWTGDEGEKGSP